MTNIARRLLVIGFISAWTHQLYASDFCIDGLCFNVLSYDTHTVSVEGAELGESYEGYLQIPATIEYLGIKWTVTTIADKAFYLYKKLKNVQLPQTIVNIGDFAFCQADSLTSINIPEGVEYIGDYAFSNCKNCSLTIPSTVNHIGSFSFAFCENLSDVTIPQGVTVIPTMAFANCINTNFTFHPRIKTIESCAFQYCSFSHIDLPDSLTSIGNGAFQVCEQLEAVTLPNSLKGELDCFVSCSKLNHVFIPDTIERVSGFYGATSLTDLHWPSFLKSVGAFGNSGIKKVEFPDTLYRFKWIQTDSVIDHVTGHDIFYQKQVVSDDGTVTIAQGSFENCLSLDTVIINDRVESIGNEAFKGSTNIKTVITSKKTPLSISSNTFSAETYMTAVLQVPVGTRDAYMEAEGWKNFTNVIEESGHNTQISQSTTSGEPSSHYSLSGQKINKTTKGIHLIRKSNGIVKKVIVN